MVLFEFALGFVWILVCSIFRVWLGIHPNPRFVESWVGNTLFCIRGVRNLPLSMDCWISSMDSWSKM